MTLWVEVISSQWQRSAPHRLANVLAKPLSSTLGSVSGTHLRNSGDLKNRPSKIGFRGKTLLSFDVKALFTSVPVDGALEATALALEGIPSDDLPLPRRDYTRLIELCVRFGSFEFLSEEYTQIEGLAMGSPLSAVMACLFMEKLEKE